MTIANVNRSKSSDEVWSVSDFIPAWNMPPKVQTKEEQIAMAVEITAYYGGQDLRKKKGLN
jgi:hypothetical protein